MSSLLADLVASRQLQPEPVATAALVNLLSRSSAGRDAVTAVFNELVGPGETSTGLSFTSQVTSADDDGRPDIVGSDQAGARLIVEAKFDAELTAIQATGAYEARLADTVTGVLLYLVPADRLAALWPELLLGPGKEAVGPAPSWPEDTAMSSCALASGNRLGALSWERLLAVLRQALETAQEIDNLADLRQLEGLVEWRGRTDWTPLLPDDLPHRAGRQLSHLIPQVLGAAQEASSTKVRNGSGDKGTGRYITTPGQHTVWVGVWFSWWSRYGHSPVWAQVKATTSQPVDLVAEALGALPHLHVRHDRGDVLVPLLLERGAELDRLRAGLRGQLDQLATALDALPVPPEPIPMDPAVEE